MRKILATIGATLAIVGVIAASASSHSEAPGTIKDPVIDNTDSYAFTASDAVSLLGGGKSFVGPVDDPFFIDLGAVFDGINIDKPGRPMIGLGNQGGGKDDVATYNVSSTLADSVLGTYSIDENGDTTLTGATKELEAAQKEMDAFLANASAPDSDAKNFGKFVLNPEPARILNGLFNLGIKENNRTDIVQALLTGIPGLTQISPKAVPADTLKLNLGVSPAASPSTSVLAADTDGFPSGRRLADDVTDIELRVIAG